MSPEAKERARINSLDDSTNPIGLRKMDQPRA